MRHLIRNRFHFLVLLILTACSKPQDLYKPPVEIKTSIDLVNITHEGGSQSFSIESNYDWNMTCSDPACVLNPAFGKKGKQQTVTVTLPENIGSDRQFTLIINANEKQKVLNVRQLGKNYAKTAADLMVDNFDILPENNTTIYIPISFVEKINNQSIFNGKQQIRYYKTELTNLVASWSSNASKVTMNNVIQQNAVTQNNYNDELTFRFYAQDDSYKDYKVKLTNSEDTHSGLPILVIVTDAKKAITNKDIWINGSFKLDPQGNTGVKVLEGVTEIRGRGNSTWGMPKKPYALKLKEKGSGTFMGMKAHKRWALLANYADKTSLRNRLAFELGKKVNLAWTPDSRFVEVILNGKFLGNYLLTEQIKIDGNRINIEAIDNKETNATKISGGWLMEVDRYYSNGESRYFRPSISQIPIIVKEPEDANAQQMAYIANYFNTFERMIFPTLPEGVPYTQNSASLAGIPDSTAYGKYVDINSFINYWIVQEITENRDARLPGSLYMHKGVDKKLVMGPLWDFDLTTFLGSKSWMHYDYVPNESDYNRLEYRAMYYYQFFKDRKFKAKVKERWNAVYPMLLNEIPKFIDKEYRTIAKSLELNWIEIGQDNSQGIWPLTSEDIAIGGRNHDKNLISSEAVSKLRGNYLQRINWMNSQISSW